MIYKIYILLYLIFIVEQLNKLFYYSMKNKQYINIGKKYFQKKNTCL